MIRTDIVREIQIKTGIDQKQATAALEVVIACIKNSLMNKKHVFLRGFGTFGLVKRKAKLVRDISRNSSFVMPEKLVPFFKPAKQFKNAVNQ